MENDGLPGFFKSGCRWTREHRNALRGMRSNPAHRLALGLACFLGNGLCSLDVDLGSALETR